MSTQANAPVDSSPASNDATPTARPLRVVVEMKGGLINLVTANFPVEVLFLDEDTEGGDEESIGEVDGQDVYISFHSVAADEVSHSVVDGQFEQAGASEGQEALPNATAEQPVCTDVEIDEEDFDLNARELDDKYNEDGEGEHPVISKRFWWEAVSRQMTSSGYWEYVVHQIEMIRLSKMAPQPAQENTTQSDIIWPIRFD